MSDPRRPGAGRSQTDVVVEGIRRLILDGALAPGDRLPIEKDLAPQLGVSRGSLREGVRALSHLGVLETRQGSGTYVTALRPETLLAPLGFVAELQPGAAVEDVQAVRRTLETSAVRIAALRLDGEPLAAAQAAVDAGRAALGADPADHEAALEADMAFHAIVAEASGNAVLASIIDALSNRTARTRLWRLLVEQGAGERAVVEHGEILDAIRARDPEAAAVRMANHLLSVETFARAHRAPAAE